MSRVLWSKGVFISDCEGPISKNDNAFEVSSTYIPNGAQFYRVVSSYDDVLAYLDKKPGYRAGSTLKLIAPFLRAYGVTNGKIIEYSLKNIILLPGAVEMLRRLSRLLPSYIVSTSYEQYIYSLCKVVGFSHNKVYCTRLDLDKYEFPTGESERLMELREEVSSYPVISIPEDARSIKDLPEKDKAIVERLDEIFWGELHQMSCGRMLDEVIPLGGEEKAMAVSEIVSKLETELASVVYVGDSITDSEALRNVKEGGGLAISFNGNRYAVENADVAVLSENALATAILVEAFHVGGKEYVLELAQKWDWKVLKDSLDDENLVASINNYTFAPPKVRVVDEASVEEIIFESSEFRRKVRGEAVGRLG